ncbi:MAG: hypothetical protein EA427_03295 [Spirochaetaceae bacterium]|nr:MAG: hypothetical protein EA427_03295 [Spirochaetaceae bacterium]
MLLAFLALLLLPGCQSGPVEIPEDLSQMEMFQRAQEAVDQERWEVGLQYYEEFIRRFPDDRGAIMEAEYEIAFIAYKQKDYDLSRRRFEAILATYEADQAGALPEWPRVLSERLIQVIDERTAPAES